MLSLEHMNQDLFTDSDKKIVSGNMIHHVAHLQLSRPSTLFSMNNTNPMADENIHCKTTTPIRKLRLYSYNVTPQSHKHVCHNGTNSHCKDKNVHRPSRNTHSHKDAKAVCEHDPRSRENSPRDPGQWVGPS